VFYFLGNVKHTFVDLGPRYILACDGNCANFFRMIIQVSSVHIMFINNNMYLINITDINVKFLSITPFILYYLIAYFIVFIPFYVKIMFKMLVPNIELVESIVLELFKSLTLKTYKPVVTYVGQLSCWFYEAQFLQTCIVNSCLYHWYRLCLTTTILLLQNVLN
jgi:hypothetical protein